MSMTQMFAAVGASLDAAAMIDVTEDGVLQGINFAGRVSAGGPGSLSFEVSFGSTSAFTVNDARQVITTFSVSVNVATENNSFNHYVPLNVPVFAGERIYFHRLLIGTVPTFGGCAALLAIQDKSTRVNRARR